MKIVVVGLGYVGLPLAIQLSKHFETWGLDIDVSRIKELRAGHDRTNEIDTSTLSATMLRLTSNAGECPPADAYIITVPTPIDNSKRPDLGPVISATKAVSGMIDPARRPVIIYESTVYPGVTDDICAPLLEAAGHSRGRDFVLGYSPERINPGDREHTVDRIVKVIAGEDDATTDLLAEIYGKVTSAGVFRAASIRAAEAAKVIENAQRDINIAFMNEITQIFAKLDLSVWDVLAAARTKWNFLSFEPGLVGGHCIGIDPYYLSHRAREVGHDAQVILAGRAINDAMGDWLADQIHARHGKVGSQALVLGLTFKENVPDLRNSKVIDVIRRLELLGHKVVVHDPLADPYDAQHEFGIVLDADALTRRYDIVIGTVQHETYRLFDADKLAALTTEDGLIADVKGMWATHAAHLPRYWSL